MILGENEIFNYIPLDLWKDIAERFLDPTSFVRLKRVNRDLKNKLDDESMIKMIVRHTVTTVTEGFITKTFLDRKYKRDKNGNTFWFVNGILHRDGDLPAVRVLGQRDEWYQIGLLHRRNDKPAIIHLSGTREWFYRGLRHRENDLPAVIRADGSQHWYYDNKRHRENDQPAVIRADGKQEWWKNGEKLKR